MQRKLDDIKIELSDRIYKLFMIKYKGNKSKFSDDCDCDEKAIRKIFNYEQGLTMNLFFKICKALQISPSDLLKDLELDD